MFVIRISKPPTIFGALTATCVWHALSDINVHNSEDSLFSHPLNQSLRYREGSIPKVTQEAEVEIPMEVIGLEGPGFQPAWYQARAHDRVFYCSSHNLLS